jgi:hypothetical protein
MHTFQLHKHMHTQNFRFHDLAMLKPEFAACKLCSFKARDSHAIRAGALNPNLINQMQQRILAEGQAAQAAALLQAANARATMAGFPQAGALGHVNGFGGMHAPGNLLFQQSQRQALDQHMMQHVKAPMMPSARAHGPLGNASLMNDFDNILPAVESALRLVDETSSMPRQSDSRQDMSGMWGSVPGGASLNGLPVGGSFVTNGGSMGNMDLGFPVGGRGMMDGAGGMQSVVGGADLHGDGALSNLAGSLGNFDKETDRENIVIGPPAFA